MKQNLKRFGQLLDEAVEKICAQTRQGKVIFLDQWLPTLGYGQKTYYRWVRGEQLPSSETLDRLATSLFKQRGLDCNQLEELLNSADFDDTEQLLVELCPSFGSNPFSFALPIHRPRQFFGRTQILKEIFHLWEGQDLFNGVIVGQRRSGKTSLLRYARDINRTNPSELRPGQRTNGLPNGQLFRWVFIDFQKPGNCLKKNLLQYILKELNLKASEPFDENEFYHLVEKQLDQPTILLMDEFDKALTTVNSELDEDFWTGMRSLIGNTNGKLGFLIAALRNPEEVALHQGISSPFFNYFHCLNLCENLGPFTQSEALELIKTSLTMCKNLAHSFSSSDVDWILAESKLWPHRLQICCYYRWNALADGVIDNRWQDQARKEMRRFESNGE